MHHHIINLLHGPSDWIILYTSDFLSSISLQTTSLKFLPSLALSPLCTENIGRSIRNNPNSIMSSDIPELWWWSNYQESFNRILFCHHSIQWMHKSSYRTSETESYSTHTHARLFLFIFIFTWSASIDTWLGRVSLSISNLPEMLWPQRRS